MANSVPNTNTFNLQNVYDVVSTHTPATIGQLQSCFDNSINSYFDPQYGSKTMNPQTLYGFRNYMIPTTISCGSSTSYSGGGLYPTTTFVTLGSHLGNVSMTFDTFVNPDRILVIFDNSRVIDTGFWGSIDYAYGGLYRQRVVKWLGGGLDSQTGLINTVKQDPVTGNSYPFGAGTINDLDGYPIIQTGTEPTYTFTKGTITTQATVLSYAGTSGSGWNFNMACPIPDPNLPTVTTYSNFQHNDPPLNSTETGFGEVLSIGGGPILERGLCYGITANPDLTYKSYILSDPGTIGAFEIVMTGLNSLQVYHCRAYAINSFGTAFGEDRTFSFVKYGDSYLGGIVADLYQAGDPGFNINVQHGIVWSGTVFAVDQWYNGSNILVGGTSSSLGTGVTNTSLIVNAQGVGTYPAKVCQDLGWALPSTSDLVNMIDQKITAGIPNNNYWSSTEQDLNGAYVVNFSTGNTGLAFKSSFLKYIAVKYF